MSTTGAALPITTTVPTTDEQWLQWALTVFGGNHARATAAAAAAAEARRAGASSDALFAAAHAAYNKPLAAATAAPVMPAKVMFKDAGARVIRPTGRSALGLTVAAILLAGIIDVFARFESNDIAPAILVLALVFGGWFALSLRSRVRIIGDTVAVQGMLHRRVFRRIDVRQITVQPRSRQWYQWGGPNGPVRGQFLVSFVDEDFAHPFELRQGAWTRADFDRIGAAIGVDVVIDSNPSIT
ncbi:MAG: hypothetical protein WCB51_09355 [Candidatus Dormiibacterota bacterium]